MRHLLPLQYVESIAKHGSIRKAAEHLAITPSALNRRLISMEEELGVALFERQAKGVRLSAAGELMLGYIRAQMSEFERVKSRIADLSGMRKGHVSIGCSIELHGQFLPDLIHTYQAKFPDVTFEVKYLDSTKIAGALDEHEIDVALAVEPEKLAEFQTVFTLVQPVVASLSKRHALAASKLLRLYECLEYPFSLPSHPSGLRSLIENASIRQGLAISPRLQSNQPEMINLASQQSDLITFDLPINLNSEQDVPDRVVIEIDSRDVKPGFLFVGHLKGRALPVAAARFMEEVVEALATVDVAV